MPSPDDRTPSPRSGDGRSSGDASASAVTTDEPTPTSAATEEPEPTSAAAEQDARFDTETATGRNETPLERWDRNFNELLQEMRVAQTGVQIFFAFLLTLPFSNRFSEITRPERVAYLVTLIAVAIAAALLIAPVSYHRMVFRRGMKHDVVRTASRLAQLGLGALLVAVCGAIYLVVDVVVGDPFAGVVTAAVGVLYVGLWYVLPLVRRFNASRRELSTSS